MESKATHTPGYEITREGRIFSISSNWRGYGKREMRQTPNSDGYPSVRLTIGSKRIRFAVHRLVAKEFLPECPGPNHEVRHLDGIKSNSSASNLAWGTVKDNADDRERHGRTSRGESHSLAIKRSPQADRTRLYHAQKREGCSV